MQHPPQNPGGSRPPSSDTRALGDRPQRRLPPPDNTGQEAGYLAVLREQRTPVVVEMLDGKEFRGVVEYYDRDMIKINRPGESGPNVFIRKKHVRCLYEDAAR
jgi:host factor-I protein